MSEVGALSRLEAVVDASGVALGIEALLPIGGRPRHFGERTGELR